MADIFSSDDPYENLDRFATWVGYVAYDRQGVPAPGYGDFHRTATELPDELMPYDIHMMDGAYHLLHDLWEKLGKDRDENAATMTTLFDGWKSAAKEQAVGYAWSFVDVIESELEAISELGKAVLELSALIYSSRLAIDGLIGAFCDACEQKFRAVEENSGFESFLVDVAKVGIAVTLAVVTTAATGGAGSALFPVIVGTVGGELAGEIKAQIDGENVPGGEWSDILDWYTQRATALKNEIDAGFQQAGKRMAQIARVEIDDLKKLEDKYIPRSAGSGVRATGKSSLGPAGPISHRLDGTGP